MSGPIWSFDTVYCFEPQKSLAEKLLEEFGDRPDIVIVAAALSDRTERTILYGQGGGATIFAEKREVDADETQDIETISAARFFSQNITADDCVVVKLNCEGAEGGILRDLAANGQLNKVANVMIDFDLRKVHGSRREPRRILRVLAASGFDRYLLAEDVMVGETHAHRIRNWLAHVPQLDSFCTRPAEIRKNAVPAPLRRRIKRFFRYLR